MSPAGRNQRVVTAAAASLEWGAVRLGGSRSSAVSSGEPPRPPWSPCVCGALVRAALALALITAGGQAWGRGLSAPAGGTLERATALVQARAFEQAATTLRQFLSDDPTNRGAKELLAFALESMGDIDGERQVRSDLAAEFPSDARIQADFGRVLERSGDEDGALRAYRRARELNADTSAPELDAAIERMRGRTAMEVGTPQLATMSDPDAGASCIRAGAAVPFQSRYHVALLGTHYAAKARTGPDQMTADALAISLVRRQGAGAYWTLGPRLHLLSPRGRAQGDLGFGGAFAGRAPIGRSLEAELKLEAETPWDESAVTVLHGGRTTGAEAHLYSRLFSGRLLLQAGARRRRLSLLAVDSQSRSRPGGWQSLGLAGADAVLWSKPGAALRGEMLDEALTARTTLSSALTLAYRHYDVSTRTTPEFNAIIGPAPRGSVDEVSVATSLASQKGDIGLEVRAGLARDSARPAQMWRAGGALIWAPTSTVRFGLGYDEANEVASGLFGQRREGWLSIHVHL
jgi:tetratricopeptide (TPR) repeat protein